MVANGKQAPRRCGSGLEMLRCRNRLELDVKDTSEATKDPRLSVSSSCGVSQLVAEVSGKESSQASSESLPRQRTAIITTLQSMQPAPTNFRGFGASLKRAVCAT